METNLHGKTGFMIRALPPYLFIERHTFIPFLKIFLEDANRVLVGVAAVKGIRHDRIDKEGNIVKTDFTVQGTDESLERSPGNTFAKGVLLPDCLWDQAGEYLLFMPAGKSVECPVGDNPAQDCGHLALVQYIPAGEKCLGNDKIQDTVPEELVPLPVLFGNVPAFRRRPAIDCIEPGYKRVNDPVDVRGGIVKEFDE
jgi:hypothetical protein